ncbi:phosphate signaling complex protein PhoU [Pseudomonadales bacterium]|jgi:phosphate transport system protein|nr:phosphate signaling complex protein PhoU [Gammaproteobacteria bacterium]MBT7539271.1 phosphate signaling complex protein PhoU [Gammaproteobacteria bacterium]MDA8880012.1 phosphate signaling complex protein PhoU [Pseudomonadales bacterium]MDC1478764.1 phosphate signaling complex protein PhoU [Pseudomonadales bacterium]|tara:strand:+ start:5618 stop:6289 length:672 start_codon:yes stop_codon:yes gene_type:complete
MSLHLQRDLDELKRDVLHLGSLVETALGNASFVLRDRRVKLAQAVYAGESVINEKEVQIEESCLKILALHQPVAIDLRFIVVVLKVNNDLERIGDLAENLTARAVYLAEREPMPEPMAIINGMFVTIRSMLKDSLDSLVKLDVDLARKVIEQDDGVDQINRQMYDDFRQMMARDASMIEQATSWLSCSRYLERIADLATNISEDVVFMVEGEVVRHQTQETSL